MSGTQKPPWMTLLDSASGITAVVAVALSGAVGLGTMYQAAYLAVYGIPLTLVRLDAVQMASQSLSAVFPLLAVVGIVVFVRSENLLDRVFRTRARRSIAEGVATFLCTLPMGYLVILSWWFLPVVFFAALLFVVSVYSLDEDETNRRSVRAAIVFAVAGFLIVYMGAGAAQALAQRGNPSIPTEIALTTSRPIDGLNGSSSGGSYEYTGLYVVYRDVDTWIFAPRGSSGDRLFFVSAQSVTAVATEPSAGAGHSSPTATPHRSLAPAAPSPAPR